MTKLVTNLCKFKWATHLPHLYTLPRAELQFLVPGGGPALCCGGARLRRQVPQDILAAFLVVLAGLVDPTSVIVERKTVRRDHHVHLEGRRQGGYD